MTPVSGKRIAVLMAMGLAIVTVPVTAEARGEKGPRIEFEALDADSDGQVTKAELDAHRAGRFAAADTDGDGTLSRDEMLARAKEGASKRMERRVDRMLEHLDANEDGKLSEEELASRGDSRAERREAMFERLDTDKSGGISKEEFEEAKASRGHRWGKHRNKAD